VKCDKCGKEVLITYLEEGLCIDCRQQLLVDTIIGKAKTCSSCAFLEARLDELRGGGSFCKKISLELTPLHVGKLILYPQANNCVHFVNKREYEKKALRGEIEPAKVRCQFCGTLFDSTLDKCSHCGGKR
jgi:hypothetical protein